MAARPVPAGRRAPTARADEEFAALYRRYGGEVLRYCRSRLGERADAEDVTQQVFVRAYGALLRGVRVRLPRHWLLRIARNECRRFASRRRRVEEVEFDEAIDVPPADEGARWSPAEIRRALDALVPTQRQALVMRELEGRPYAEIARELRLSLSAVETLLFRARRSLREQLDGALACDAAERALSLELDGRLPEAEKPGLRAHLRGCDDCRRLARRHRARRHALRTLVPIPLPGQLVSVVGGGGAVAGGATVGTGAVAKAVALLAVGAVSTSVGITAARPAAEPEPKAAPAEAPPALQAQPAPQARVRVDKAPTARAPVTKAAAGATTTPSPASAAAEPEAPAAAIAVAAAAPGSTEAAAASAGEPAAAEPRPTVLPPLPLPVEPPPLPSVEPPTLPVQPPTLSVEPPTLPPLPPLPDLPPPLDPDLPDLPGLP